MRAILICGHGVMGRGVALSFAAAGFDTVVWSRRVHDPDPRFPNLTFVTTLPKAPPDLAIELVAEDVDAKRAVYVELETAYPQHPPVIATGTSGLDLEVLAANLSRPERFVGLHYFMPAESAPIVEVMAGPRTPHELVDSVATVVAATGKDPVRIYQPTIGFVVNRLQHAILHEAYHLIEAGIANAADIDRAARRLLGPRMCAGGLLEQKDVGGLAIHAAAQRSIVPALFHAIEPSPMLQAMVARGETGLAAGRGFYDWRGLDVASVRADAAGRLESVLRLVDALERAAPPPRDLP